MQTLLFTPKSKLITYNKQNYCISGYIAIDIIEPNEDLDHCVFANDLHYNLYKTLTEFGTFELHNKEDL